MTSSLASAPIPARLARYTAALTVAGGYFARAAASLGVEASTVWHAIEAHPELWPAGLERHGRGQPPLPDAVREAQAQDLMRLLVAHGGDVRAAAAAEGLSRGTLLSRIRRLLGGRPAELPPPRRGRRPVDLAGAMHAAGGDRAAAAQALGISRSSLAHRLRYVRQRSAPAPAPAPSEAS